MTSDQSEALNTLTFDFGRATHTRVSILIDGKKLLEEWDLGGRFVPLSYHELAAPFLALEDIYLQCESVSIDCLHLGSCGCGNTGCDAVFCDVTVAHGEMVWQNFATNGPSFLPHIGPFRFDWDQVLRDLRKARDDRAGISGSE